MTCDRLAIAAAYQVYHDLPEPEQKELSSVARRRAEQEVESLSLPPSPSAFGHQVGKRYPYQLLALIQGNYGPELRTAEAKLRAQGTTGTHWTLLPDAYERVVAALGNNRRSLQPRKEAGQGPGIVKQVAQAFSFVDATARQEESDWPEGRE